MEEIFHSFHKSLEQFRDVLSREKTIVSRDAAIKRFEFCVELAWKSAQHFLRGQEIVCRSPKECFREAFKFGLIADDPRWVEMLEDRNATVHTYNEAFADEVYERLPAYLELMFSLEENIREQTGEK